MPRPLPQDDLHVEVSDEQVAFFRANGFLAVPRLTTDAEVAWLSQVYDELQAQPKSFMDVTRPYGASGPDRLGQLLFPELRVPALRETLYLRNARRVASRLLDVKEDALLSWGHLIHKPPLHGRATPWHQDEAYWEPGFDYCALGAWLPLDDVGPDNGCMCFLPGSHGLGVLPHRHVGGDPAVHLLELDVACDTERAVEVPLRAGGATFHHRRTIHGTAANGTDRPRRAFANEFQTPPRARERSHERPWVDEGKRAFEQAAKRGFPA